MGNVDSKIEKKNIKKKKLTNRKKNGYPPRHPHSNRSQNRKPIRQPQQKQTQRQPLHNYNNVTYEESSNSNYSPMDRNLQVSDLSNQYQDNRIIDKSREQYKDNLVQGSFQNNIHNNIQHSLYQEMEKPHVRQSVQPHVQPHIRQSVQNEGLTGASASNSVNDPYDILQLDRNANVNQLKKAYLRLAKVYHPDRGGSPALFNIIEKAYQTLLNKLSYTNDHKINQPVRDQDYEDNINKPVENVYVDKDNFNVNKFNTVFDEYRIGNANDDGYGNQMDTSTKLRKDPEQERMFSGGFNKNTFNSAFKKKNTTNKIIKYDEPLAFQQNTKVSYQELGQISIDNYGGSSDSGKLNYTDYMQAHDENRKYIDPDSVKYKKYKDINALKSERSNISHKLSKVDRERIEKRKRREEAIERERLDQVKFQDRQWESQHNQLNRLFIKQ